MASGDVVIYPQSAMPSATLGAPPRVLSGGSTPNERYLVWQFDDTTIWYVDYVCVLEGYDGGGLTIRMKWSAAANSGNGQLGAAIRRIADDAEDTDTSHTYAFNDMAAAAAPSAIGEVGYDDVTFTDGADMDSLADGESFILRFRRNTGASDTISGNVYLWGFTGRET